MNTRIFLLFTLFIGSGIISACKKEMDNDPELERIIVGRGPEDIFLDENRILVSCDERREGQPVFAEIVALDPATKKTTVLTRKSEPESLRFHPHGFYLQTVGGKKSLYIVNHYKDDAQLNSVLVYEVKGDELHFQREYRHKLLISPNEICALPNGSFYFTNDMGSDDMIYEQLFNKHGGSLVHCDASGNCKYVDEKLAFPNGLELKGQQLYMATTRNNALFRYDIQPDGSLTNKYKLSSVNGMDNLRWSGNKLIVAVHPDEIAFVKHSTNEKSHSPSWIYSIDSETGQSNLIYKNGGYEISGGSTGLIYNGYLYISQVYGDYLLKVKM